MTVVMNTGFNSGVDVGVDVGVGMRAATTKSNLLFCLVVRRYERASMIVTSNKSLLDWGEVFNDHVLATAILDRLLHHATTLNINGESYRLKEKRKAGIMGKPKPVERTEKEVLMEN
jgi:hypothetical protein